MTTASKQETKKGLPTVSLAMIVRNEEKYLPRCLDSVKDHVDEIIIVDTGSTDKTKEVAEKYGAKVYDFEWVDDFSKARNFSFSKSTKDWILWLDADDEIDQPQKLKPILADMSKKYTGLLMQYFYGFDNDGNCTALHLKTRVVKNEDNFKWVGRIHEDLIPQKTTSVNSTDDVAVYHRADDARVKRSSDRNIRIAEKEYKEKKTDPRVVFNLANAHLALGNWHYATKYYLEYLPMSGWDEERYIALTRIGLSLQNVGEFDDSSNMYLRAVKEKPQYADAYRGLAHCAMKKGELDKAEEYLLMTLSKKKPESIIVWNPFEYEVVPYYELAQVYFNMRRVDDAYEAAQIYVEKSNGRKEGMELLERIADVKADMDFMTDFVSIGEKLESMEMKDNLSALLSAVPREYRGEPRLVALRNRNFVRTESSGRDIVINCGRSHEEWDGNSLKTGIGGSEEAVIRLARIWVKRGWNVTVYCMCGHEEKVIDGVTYKPYWELNTKDKCDVYIAWRTPVDFDFEINAKVKLLDLHDVPNMLDYSTKRIQSIDKIMMKTAYHRSLLPNVPNKRIKVVGHGVDVNEFKKYDKVKRKMKQVCYTSSYDRGLEHLLDMWPDVLKEVPGATLKVAYGWDLYDRMRTSEDDKRWKEQMVDKMSHPSISELGRLSHGDVAKLMSESGVYAYPCHFEEIYCISAAKAQVAGAVPIVTVSDSCLRETVKRGVIVTGSIKDNSPEKEKALEMFKDHLVSVLKDEEKQEKMRKEVIETAREEFSWDKVADSWEEEFRV